MDYAALANELLGKLPAVHRGMSKVADGEFWKGETYVLGYLLSRNGRTLPSEMSADLGISTARVAATLNSLERKGLILRKIDDADRRKINVSITEEGALAVSERRREVAARIGTMLSMLGEEDAGDYVRIVGRIIDIFGSFPLSGEGRGNPE